MNPLQKIEILAALMAGGAFSEQDAVTMERLANQLRGETTAKAIKTALNDMEDKRIVVLRRKERETRVNLAQNASTVGKAIVQYVHEEIESKEQT